jgi:hypothetical protein
MHMLSETQMWCLQRLRPCAAITPTAFVLSPGLCVGPCISLGDHLFNINPKPCALLGDCILLLCVGSIASASKT